MASEARQLAQIRDHAARIDPEWQLVADGGVMMIHALNRGQRLEILRDGSMASTDDLQFAANAPTYVRFLLKLVDRAIARLREMEPAKDEPREPNFAAEAAIKCTEPAFKRFLMERRGLESPANDERTAQKLRSLLGITSRRALNDDAAAAERWKALRADFETWKRAG